MAVTSSAPLNAPPADAAPTPRYAIVDVARGVALLAMVVYHFAWDLSFLRLIETNIVSEPFWRLLARATAASFLALVGASLVLAHRRGIRWRPFLRRLGTVALAAAGITLATRLTFPDSYIFFGILHCIALSSVLALPFLRLPLTVTATAALGALAAPSLLAAPVFDTPALQWLGLMTYAPRTNDYVPIFPWFGAVLFGIVVARLLLQHAVETRAFLWRPTARPGRFIAFAGRHTLVVYLLHQPVLLGTLFLVAAALGPNEAAETAPFLRSCEASCVASGWPQQTCGRYCSCVTRDLKTSGLWADVLRDRLDDEKRERLAAITHQCRPGVDELPGESK
ncbi:heparan-alpha-glucosaminide N-acetyltransferase [Chelatococcus sp. SYSU_G07232]|uniref:Heparan-alpha-glucosaminide N-acetyltransferase n=1 Tax=Chelatococcus albus TaxID=3047466 RepID=A0ABT7ADA2_9HYPH|nr:heparan-alpha-glucosaminide N-acetyltransferase [Chelatococcus sp. SYSU_G07232]MDJ1157045.1 heparan-alpha-glucosaminide N-acetyltransferase [Chelatococcus sp. SYSU_G07232]